MCQGVKDGEKQGTSKAGRQEVARQAERKPKGSEFLRAGEDVLETKQSSLLLKESAIVLMLTVVLLQAK